MTAVPSGDPRPVKGVVTFIDNAVDAATGTIRLKATFANEEGRLWPGQFANVTLTLATEPDAIVIPSQAVQTGQQGAFVFVVKPDSTVDLRRIATARTQGGETVIAKGLQAGEQVVTDGQARLTPGAKVEIRSGERGGKAAGEGGGGRPAKAGGEVAGSDRQRAGEGGGERPAKGAGEGGAERAESRRRGWWGATSEGERRGGGGTPGKGRGRGRWGAKREARRRGWWGAIWESSWRGRWTASGEGRRGERW